MTEHNDNQIIVSISCITYNHAPYIRQCLDGFLMQQTNFAYEVLIHDDASTDGTTEIIKEYEAKYPDIIKPIYEDENQWVKGRRGSAVFNFPRAKGKYIALCEGDDYWTDPLKLQKQVYFLEKHQECSLCCHQYDMLSSENIVKSDNMFDGVCFDLQEYISSKQWIIQPLTILFRKSCFDLQEYAKYEYAKDVTLFYYLLTKGNAYRMPDNMGVYRLHLNGVFSSLNYTDKLLSNFKTILGISIVENTPIAAQYLKGTIDDMLPHVGLRFVAKNLRMFISANRQLASYFGRCYIYDLILQKLKSFLKVYGR